MNSLYQCHRTRIGIVTITIMFVFAVLSLRLIYIQIIKHDEYSAIAKKNTIGTRNIHGSRGIIYDRSGTALTYNLRHHTFWMDTRVHQEIDEVCEIFSTVFNKPINHYRKLLTRKSNYVVIEKNVVDPLYSDLLNKLKGKNVGSDTVTKRHYPFGDLAAQVIGYTNTENLGVVGIERQYNSILSGTSGLKNFSKKANGKLCSNIYEDDYSFDNGRNITLTIDIEYQAILQDELKLAIESSGALSANGIIIEPYTGEVFAMATLPSFDLNSYFDYPIQYHQNKVISGAYEPGSTFKIVGVSAGLDENLISPWEKFNCEDGEYHTLNRIFHDHKPHDELTVSEILMHSSNIGMVKIADKIGSERIFRYSVLHGFGEPTGIQLPMENSGILRNFKDWTRSSGPTIAMGQEIAATTLQSALSYCSIANGGYLLKPSIIKSISRNSHNDIIQIEPQVIRSVMGGETSKAVLSMLCEVINKGTADKAQMHGFSLAGKTSTAQKFVDGSYSKTEFMSAFAGIYPSHQPRLVCLVVVDSPQYGKHWGNETAAPIVKKVIERIINLDSNKQDVKILFAAAKNSNNDIKHLALQTSTVSTED